MKALPAGSRDADAVKSRERRSLNQINVVTDSDDGGSVFETQLEPHFAVACLHPDDLPAAAPGRFTLVDVNLRDAARVSGLKQWLERRPDDSHVVFGVNRQRPVESVQAYAVGATDVICKPIDPRMIIWKFSTGADAFGGDGEPPFEMCENLSTTMKALQNIFSAAFLNEPPDLRLVDTASGMLVERIEEVGLARWLNVMRMHHSQTYQHSLIVTSVAVSFGKHLGFSNVDKKRLASAGLLHDIGKARIPLEILEKPAALDEAEMETIRTHPLLGYEALKEVDDLHPEMLDMVVHRRRIRPNTLSRRVAGARGAAGDPLSRDFVEIARRAILEKRKANR